MDNSMLEDVRSRLLTEALASPGLMEDLAGLESYISESYYCRSLIELLQNADDAGASSFSAYREKGMIVVANDGREFAESDLESLCRSAHSTKTDEKTIGFRGIGFKSIVSFSSQVFVVSGKLQACFSKDLTKATLPNHQEVPLIRIPHPIENSRLSEINEIYNNALQNGFKTVFIFACISESNLVEEAGEFEPGSVIFLKNIKKVRMRFSNDINIAINRLNQGSKSDIILQYGNNSHKWHTISSGASILAFRCDGDKVVPLAKEESLVYNFLPTEESTGFPFIVQGNFSTDPSRRRLIMDDKTHQAIESLAELFLNTLNRLVTNGEDDYTQVLSPFDDPRLINLRRRGFTAEFLNAIHKLSNSTFNTTLIRPSWLNGKDFNKILSNTETLFLAPKHETAEMMSLLKFLGAKEAKIEDIPVDGPVHEVSAIGKVEISSHIVSRVNAGQPLPLKVSEMKIWETEEGVKSIKELTAKAVPLKESFLEKLQENNIARRDLQRVLDRTGGKPIAHVIVPEAQTNDASSLLVEEPTGFKRLVQSSIKSYDVVKINSKKWRHAELVVMDVILASGCDVTDVSKQNVGYDLDVRDADGGSRFAVEIKSIDYPGQPFSMTSNETNVAHELADDFVLALVVSKHDRAEIQFIVNPLKKLKFERKCRQWVMECDRYFFNPAVFPLKED